MTYSIFTVGWEPWFANDLLVPIEEQTGISFTHGLVGDAARAEVAQKTFHQLRCIALSLHRGQPLPAPDPELLASLECEGVPTVRSMIQGDRVLRFRPEQESLGYATLLARRLREELTKHQPDLVLASHDSLHSAMSLAVAKSLQIPWVALAFPVIPDDLTGFCRALTPNSLVPLIRPVNEELRIKARILIENVRAKNQKVAAYKAPASLSQWLRQYLLHAKNLLRRRHSAKILGIDRFTYPTAADRINDILRRTYNRLCLPTTRMLTAPPPGPYLYYPMHMAPESMVDTWAPFYQNQLGFLEQLALAVPADTTLVIKLHFSDPDNYSLGQLLRLLRMPCLRIAHPNASGSAFIEQAALVLGIQGTSCLEAALLGKPVLIFGDSPYLHFPRSERARRPDELYGQIKRMLDQEPPAETEIVEAYAAYMARYLPGRINDWNRPLASAEISQLATCFLQLSTYLAAADNRAHWYQGSS